MPFVSSMTPEYWHSCEREGGPLPQEPFFYAVPMPYKLFAVPLNNCRLAWGGGDQWQYCPNCGVRLPQTQEEFNLVMDTRAKR